MKISEVEIFPVSIPTIKPYALSFGVTTAANSVLIKIHTDEKGVFGIGEAAPWPTFGGETPETVMDVLRGYLVPAIIGMDPTNIEYIHNRMDKVIEGNSFAKAAIDIALYDILGKKLGVPVYELLGGLYREELPLMWPLMDADLKSNVKDASESVKRGFKTFCIKVGFLTPEEDVARVAAIRDAVGYDIGLWVDANQGWTPQIAIKRIKEMEKYQIAWFEQPVPKDDIDGLVMIRGAVDTLISADESLYSMRNAFELAKRNAVDIFSIKVQKQEGLCKAKKVAAIAEAAGIPIFMNSVIEAGVSVAASLHFAVSTPNVMSSAAALMSSLRLQDDIIKVGGLQFDHGVIKVTRKPGLGVELDEQKVAKYAYTPKS